MESTYLDQMPTIDYEKGIAEDVKFYEEEEHRQELMEKQYVVTPDIKEDIIPQVVSENKSTPIALSSPKTPINVKGT
jgi:hypothetical protein